MHPATSYFLASARPTLRGFATALALFLTGAVVAGCLWYGAQGDWRGEHPDSKTDDATQLAETALARAVAEPQKAAAESGALVDRALALDPDNRKALALAGTLALQRKDYATALSHWERLAPLEPPDSPVGRQLRAGIAEAKKRSAQPK